MLVGISPDDTNRPIVTTCPGWTVVIADVVSVVPIDSSVDCGMVSLVYLLIIFMQNVFIKQNQLVL
jgi:hypothetical protein